MTYTDPSPLSDLERLRTLYALELLDTPTDPAFDRLTSLASRILRAPVALVSLVDHDRQFFKSCVGLPEPWASTRETPLSHSFCQHTVVTAQPLIISDARVHPQVRDNLAIRDLNVIAYAGIPLITDSEQVVGSFCVIDHQPREWTNEEIAILTDLAASVMKEIALRSEVKARKQLEEERAGLLAQAQAAHEAAERERQRLYDLFMQAPALIAVLRGRDGVCELFNPMFRQLSGQRDVVGKPMREAWPELENQGFFELVEQVYQTGEAIHGNEYRGMIDRRNDGTLEEAFFNFVYAPYYNADGAVEGVMIHGVDVTEQVQARRKVEESEKRAQLAFDAAQMGFWDLDLVHQTAIRSLRHDQIFGYEHLQDRWNIDTFLDHVVPADQEYARLRLEEAFRSGNLHLQCRVQWPDTSIHWIDVRGNVFFDAQRTPIRMLGVITDITERKQLEQQKDAFISMASHELNTPLTSLKGFSELMQRTARKQGDTTYDRYLHKIHEQATRLTRLVSDLLDVTRVQQSQLRYEFEYFWLDECVEQVVENFRETHAQREFVIEGTTQTAVFGDRDRIQQVLNNLISNAIKYSPNGKSVNIRLSEDSQNAFMSVQDFGIGIDEQHQQKIFERFYRGSEDVQSTYAGLGIGLYLAAEIVKRHGGHLWVESKKDQGSTFCVSLPLSVAVNAREAGAS